ncbi:sulfur carrier protein ThiS [Marinagarivorans cellulosilyticus]|uniref:Sulfur carrier protein n=1 Tax=Marinagarivorans cellulosilyticus TaxID=2721545 RepID=A0AAN2BL97_9GAMM|nr:sulfur carrier protein ThiS [Marinagarivorans cellulosilyticus]BCD98869.1 sulfur carrier protein [Marinagarivorans cellulosilyticus]
MTTTINISINGERQDTAENNLAKLIATLNTGDQYAVARNGEFVPKRLHEETVLEDGDTLDIVTPVGGG